eukprot:symbB.v1.2.025328.t1/scaffold2447.1/size78899/2
MLRHPSSASELRDLTLTGNEPQDNAENCGTTAVCCLIQGQEMILAHVGDSRAVLCKQGLAVRLTEDHKLGLPIVLGRLSKQIHQAFQWESKVYQHPLLRQLVFKTWKTSVILVC